MLSCTVARDLKKILWHQIDLAPPCCGHELLRTFGRDQAASPAFGLRPLPFVNRDLRSSADPGDNGDTPSLLDDVSRDGRDVMFDVFHNVEVKDFDRPMQ